MRGLKKYWRIYSSYLSLSFSEAMSFRLHFFLELLVSTTFFATSIAAIYFLYNHVDHIGSWSREEFLFFTAFMLAIDHFQMTFLSQNLWNIPIDIRKGNIDFIFVKPVPALFPLFFQRIRPAGLLISWAPLALIIFFGLKLSFAPWQWILLPGLLLLGTALLIAIELLISLGMFWTFESNGINFLRMQIQSLARWPDFVYLYFFRKIFTFLLPILVVGSMPVHFLLDPKGSLLSLFGLVLALLGVIGAIALVWGKAKRAYESASS